MTRTFRSLTLEDVAAAATVFCISLKRFAPIGPLPARRRRKLGSSIFKDLIKSKGFLAILLEIIFYLFQIRNETIF